MSIYTVKLIGEVNDIKPKVIASNIVVKTMWNGMKMMNAATWCKWERLFIFPDNEKAEYFSSNFHNHMNDYREGMMKDDYVFHIVDLKYPEPKELYADQIRMTKDFEFSLY